MNFRHRVGALAASALLLAAGAVRAEGTFDIPAGAHFNPQKLEKIGEFFKNEVATGKIPGAIVLIEQHGKPVYHEFFGVRDPATKAPMTDDTIFRIFSMSKPITSVAAMMLIDQGKLKLDDAIEKYIPSFGQAKVGVEKKADNGEKSLDLSTSRRVLDVAAAHRAHAVSAPAVAAHDGAGGEPGCRKRGDRARSRSDPADGCGRDPGAAGLPWLRCPTPRRAGR